MAKNNKGFTLVELLVSVVIFGVVLAAAFGFMLASAKSYNKVNDRLEIQNQSQAALNLIEEYVIDCNLGVSFVGSSYVKDGISYPTGTLYILNEEENGDYTVHIFKLGSDEILRYAEVTVTDANVVKDAVTGQITLSFSEPEGYKVTDKAVTFSVSYTPDAKTLEIGTVDITLGMIKRSANYEGTINIALRNKPVVVTVN